MKPSLLMILAVALAGASCGSGDETATLFLRVHSASSSALSLRGFDPNNPPERIQVLVLRSSNLAAKAVANVDQAWSQLPIDPQNGYHYLGISVPANATMVDGGSVTGQDPYLLKLSSLVTSTSSHQLEVDACGTIGQILASPGEKLQLDMITHSGDCSLPCSHDTNCIGSRFCLSFECHDSQDCGSSKPACPAGAYCSQSNQCASSCTPDVNPCLTSTVCCGGICSVHCPT